nr:hypothetical protein [Acidipila rosea]
MLQHLLRDVASDVHDRLVACAALGKLGDERVPVVMPAPLHARIRADIAPDGLERRDVARRVGRLG